jgi:hypothetical protein
MALVSEARRLADDLCRHWERTGESPSVQEVAGWLPETVVGDLWSLAGAVEEAWRENTGEGPKEQKAGSVNALVEHAQRLLRRIQWVLEERFSHMEPLDPALLEPPSRSPMGTHRLSDLADALRDHLRMIETFNDELSEKERLGPHWIEEGHELVDLLMQEVEPGPKRAPEKLQAHRLQTLAVRLQSLLRVARRAASEYSVQVGFTPEPGGAGSRGTRGSDAGSR